MKVHNQLGDTLAGELLHSIFNIVLELVEVGGAESADIHLGVTIRRGKKVFAKCVAYCSGFTVWKDVRFDGACATRNSGDCRDILRRQADSRSVGRVLNYLSDGLQLPPLGGYAARRVCRKVVDTIGGVLDSTIGVPAKNLSQSHALGGGEFVPTNWLRP